MNKINRPTTAARKFEYRPPSLQSMKERAENTGRKFDSIFKPGFDVFRPRDGINNLRYLPPTWDDPTHYGYEVHLHSFVGPSKSTYLCPARMLNKPCAMCEMAERMAAEPENAKKLQPRTGYILWILDRNDPEAKTLYKPKLWQMSWTMNQEFNVLAFNSKTPEKTLYIDNPDIGYDVAFKREGKGLNTTYLGLQIEREQSPIAENDDDYWAIIDFIQNNPIPSVLNFYDYEHLRKVITGQVAEVDEDEEDDNGSSQGGNTRETEAGSAPRRRAPPADEAATGDAEEAIDEGVERQSNGNQPRQRSTRAADPPQDGSRERPRPRGRQEEDTPEDDEGETRRPARAR
jgi:hypothetical protein